MWHERAWKWGGVWCGGMGEKEHSEMVWPYGKDGNEEFVKKVYLSRVEGTNRRGRPLVRWENRVREYVNERGVRGNALDWARRECMDSERWRSFCRGHPFGVRSRRERGVRAID